MWSSATRATSSSVAEQIVTDLGAKHGFDVTCTKDGGVFVPENLAKFDAFVFETPGRPDRGGVRQQPADAARRQERVAQGHRGRQGLRRLPLRQRHLPQPRASRPQPGTE